MRKTIFSVGAGRALDPVWLADTTQLVEYLLPSGARIDFRPSPGVAFSGAHEMARHCDDIYGKHQGRTAVRVEAMIAELAIDPSHDLASIAESTSMTAEAVYARWKNGSLQLHMRLADRAIPVKGSQEEGRVAREKAGFREALDLAPLETFTSEDSGVPVHRLRLGAVRSITQPDAYQLQQDALKYMVTEVPLLGAGVLLSS